MAAQPSPNPGPALAQTSRRFLPTPIEASTWSSKSPPPALGALDQSSFPASELAPSSDGNPAQVSSAEPAAASLLFQNETRTRPNSQTEHAIRPKKARFAPTPFEISYSTNANRTSPDISSRPRSPPTRHRSPGKSKRRFAPQLIETSSRSRKAADADANLDRRSRTDAIPSSDSMAASSVLRAQRTILPSQRRRQPTAGRQHSFRLPDLETIESSGSEPSDTSRSSSFTPESPTTSSEPAPTPYLHTKDKFVAEIDADLERYLLGLEAKRIEQVLHEQALAAYPNSDYHEPVEHYVNLDDGYDDRPATWEGHEEDFITTSRPFRREDTLKVNWDLYELRQYRETIEQEDNAMKTTAKRRPVAKQSSPFWRVNQVAHDSPSELQLMRESARPPMLGDDIKFPRSDSPEPARFDVTQGSHRQRSSTCHWSEHGEVHLVSDEGLWGGMSRIAPKETNDGLWGGLCAEHDNRPEIVLADAVSNGNGTVTATHDIDADLSNEDLATPLNESAHDPYSVKGDHLNPPDQVRRLASAPELKCSRTNSILDTGNGKDVDDPSTSLSESDLDAMMESEYPEEFVTQVFNYLSLGYPSLARPFDEELSSITGVSMAELRSDDMLVATSVAKGYIRLDDDPGSAHVSSSVDALAQASDQHQKDDERQDGSHGHSTNSGTEFARWRALKLYIRHWARCEHIRALELREQRLQHSNGRVDAHGKPHEHATGRFDDVNGEMGLGVAGIRFGTAPRRGSWAW